jgi:hypothetical protein
MLGLKLALILSKPDGSIALWFADVIGRIGSLPVRLRQVLQTEVERIVNLVGNLILTRVHRFAPVTRIFERFGDNATGRAAEETARAAVAEVVAQLLQRVNRYMPEPEPLGLFSFMYYCSCILLPRNLHSYIYMFTTSMMLSFYECHADDV